MKWAVCPSNSAAARTGSALLDRLHQRLVLRPFIGDEKPGLREVKQVELVTDGYSQNRPAELAAIWDQVVETFIAYELAEWDRLNAQAAPTSSART